MINQITVKGSNDDTINGMYKLHKLDNVDDNTLSYYKDEKHQIYRYNNMWKIGHHGKKVYIQLDFCIGEDMNVNEIDVSNIKKDIKHENFIYILKPVINENSITYHFIINNIKKTVTNKFLTNENIYTGIEGIISIFVPHCILTGKTISSEIPVDKLFLENLQNLVPVFRKWHNNNDLKLNINVPIKSDNIESIEKKTISTFTMGVDSFYTLYSNIDKIDAILFIIGFDIQIEQKDLLDKTIKNLKKVAEIYNKKLILCETDSKNKLPANSGKGFKWGEYFHGPALFNIIYNLNDYGELIIPSSHISRDYIWGSTFQCDKYYSSYKLNIIHDGYLTRNDKIDYITNFDIRCLDYLRVCWKNPEQSYNCSECEKCSRTMFPFFINGILESANTFEKQIKKIEYKKSESSQNSEMEEYRYKLRYIKKKNDMVNLGYIDNPKTMLEEINKLNAKYFDKKAVEGKTSTKLYENTFGWCGIPLINDSGLTDSDGLRFAGSNAVNGSAFIHTEYLKNSEYFKNLIRKIETKFETKCGLTRILKLTKGGYIDTHKDGSIFNKKIFRCHIPIVTKYPDVFMNIDNESYHMIAGNLYLTDTSKLHSVTNNSDIDRIHIVIDLVYSKKLLEFINKGLPTKLIPLYEINNNSNELIVCFSGLGTNSNPHFLFQSTLKNTNKNILFIRDIEMSWYTSGIVGITYDTDTNIQYLKEYIKKYTTVTFIGQSGGGFAALYYGNLLNVDKIIAFSPQTFLDLETKKTFNDNRWLNNKFYKYITNYDKTILNLNNIPFSKKSKIYIHYGINNEDIIDKKHAYYIKDKSVNINYYEYEVVNCPHRLTIYLKEKGLLNNILTEQI
jgi:hypothetical protein